MLNRLYVVAFVLLAGCSVASVTFTPAGFDAGAIDVGATDAGAVDAEAIDAPGQDVATITVTKTGAGTVTSLPVGIDCGETCAQSFRAGTQVALMAQPGAGFRFAGWSGACTGAACTIDVAGSAGIEVAALFSPLVTLTVALAGDATGTVESDVGGISCGATQAT